MLTTRISLFYSFFYSEAPPQWNDNQYTPYRQKYIIFSTLLLSPISMDNQVWTVNICILEKQN